jgi:lipopolysaccharide/colanic/teichoic acid biosynthesis glycosyltransferase
MGRDSTLLGVPGPARFRSQTRRQRALAERTGTPFALVLFQTQGGRWRPDEARHFIRLLNARVRLTDSVGWFDDRRLGVILANTGTQGGIKFASQITHLAELEEQLSYDIYVYPADLHPDSDELPPPHNRQDHDDTPDAQPAGDGPSDGGNQRRQGLPLERLLVARPPLKRLVDIVGASVALILALPFMLVIAAVIKLGSRGPLLFKQVRIGLGGKPFEILKFRTMKPETGSSNHQQHLKQLIRSNSSRVMQKLDTHDPRIIFGGRLIRATGLDELPQIFNILRGDMSLVGPRPCLPYEARELENWQRGRFDVMPGVTGLWQVSGKNRLSFKRMTRLDVAYARRLSPWRDVGIILRTPRVILDQLVDHLRTKEVK